MIFISIRIKKNTDVVPEKAVVPTDVVPSISQRLRISIRNQMTS